MPFHSHDAANHPYEELDLDSGWLRITVIDPGWTGEPAVRIQIRKERGTLNQGPEVPLSLLPRLMCALSRIPEMH